MRSFDAKAYIRCGTDVGFSSSRNQRILLPSDPCKARALPKYDFPNKDHYITPCAHKIMRKEEVSVNGAPTLVTSNNTEVVFVRPKCVLSDSATVWANEAMELQYLHPQDLCIQPLVDDDSSESFSSSPQSLVRSYMIFLS
jgi:hypothetical protein